MTKKVNLAIFDADLKARTVGKYEVTDGNQIRVKSGGEGHFMPYFDNNSFLEFPYRSILSPWKISWKRVYMVRKGARKCVSFQPKGKIKIKERKTVSGKEEVEKEYESSEIDVHPPDPELVKDTANGIMFQNLGDVKETNPIVQYIILLLLMFVAWGVVVG